MRIPAIPIARPPRRLHRDQNGRLRFIDPSSLGATILGMISSNSLAAFTAEVSRNAGIQGGAQAVRGAAPEAGRQAPAVGRTLGAVPPSPGQVLPRGSLLDLRV
ncbi:hypothetical protein [Plastoroseomonas arctica]|uniref:Uncharacterized protein n=1 Tax=Plastoroseomonas arctica TaxID=1509237 RepID=A0AAF1K503_9PROT|nr:hypothetical protein [Plastoroseomonas arctica]MBR0655880.1 hypothetical protein [Plastoroseomonas arctica]